MIAWILIAATVGFALGFMTCALLVASKAEMPEPPKHGDAS